MLVSMRGNQSSDQDISVTASDMNTAKSKQLCDEESSTSANESACLFVRFPEEEMLDQHTGKAALFDMIRDRQREKSYSSTCEETSKPVDPPDGRDSEGTSTTDMNIDSIKLARSSLSSSFDVDHKDPPLTGVVEGGSGLADCIRRQASKLSTGSTAATSFKNEMEPNDQIVQEKGGSVSDDDEAEKSTMNLKSCTSSSREILNHQQGDNVTLEQVVNGQPQMFANHIPDPSPCGSTTSCTSSISSHFTDFEQTPLFVGQFLATTLSPPPREPLDKGLTPLPPTRHTVQGLTSVGSQEANMYKVESPGDVQSYIDWICSNNSRNHVEHQREQPSKDEGDEELEKSTCRRRNARSRRRDKILDSHENQANRRRSSWDDLISKTRDVRRKEEPIGGNSTAAQELPTTTIVSDLIPSSAVTGHKKDETAHPNDHSHSGKDESRKVTVMAVGKEEAAIQKDPEEVLSQDECYKVKPDGGSCNALIPPCCPQLLSTKKCPQTDIHEIVSQLPDFDGVNEEDTQPHQAVPERNDSLDLASKSPVSSSQTGDPAQGGSQLVSSHQVHSKTKKKKKKKHEKKKASKISTKTTTKQKTTTTVASSHRRLEDVERDIAEAKLALLRLEAEIRQIKEDNTMRRKEGREIEPTDLLESTTTTDEAKVNDGLDEQQQQMGTSSSLLEETVQKLEASHRMNNNTGEERKRSSKLTSHAMKNKEAGASKSKKRGLERSRSAEGAILVNDDKGCPARRGRGGERRQDNQLGTRRRARSAEGYLTTSSTKKKSSQERTKSKDLKEVNKKKTSKPTATKKKSRRSTTSNTASSSSHHRLQQEEESITATTATESGCQQKSTGGVRKNCSKEGATSQPPPPKNSSRRKSLERSRSAEGAILVNTATSTKDCPSRGLDDCRQEDKPSPPSTNTTKKRRSRSMDEGRLTSTPTTSTTRRRSKPSREEESTKSLVSLGKKHKKDKTRSKSRETASSIIGGNGTSSSSSNFSLEEERTTTTRLQRLEASNSTKAQESRNPITTMATSSSYHHHAAYLFSQYYANHWVSRNVNGNVPSSKVVDLCMAGDFESSIRSCHI